MSIHPDKGLTRRLFLKGAATAPVAAAVPSGGGLTVFAPTAAQITAPMLLINEAKAALTLKSSFDGWRLAELFSSCDLMAFLKSDSGCVVRPSMVAKESQELMERKDLYSVQLNELNAFIEFITGTRNKNIDFGDMTSKAFELWQAFDEDGIGEDIDGDTMITNLKALGNYSGGDINDLAQLVYRKTKHLAEKIIEQPHECFDRDMFHRLFNFDFYFDELGIQDQVFTERIKSFARAGLDNIRDAESKIASPAYNKNCEPDKSPRHQNNIIVTLASPTKNRHRFRFTAPDDGTVNLFDVQRMARSVNPLAKMSAEPNGGKPGLVVAVTDPAVVAFFYGCVSGKKKFPLRRPLFANSGPRSVVPAPSA